ncbi:hypothetical protein [Komagataeibacter xylinus]|uniref:hypothetical protein n=1 Tax=Komagataeibacter xylinus TaxID=28448 RepID=UPI00280AA2DA|nr:hypothetical protein [Komagataeibacter xylinus]
MMIPVLFFIFMLIVAEFVFVHLFLMMHFPLVMFLHLGPFVHVFRVGGERREKAGGHYGGKGEGKEFHKCCILNLRVYEKHHARPGIENGMLQMMGAHASVLMRKIFRRSSIALVILHFSFFNLPEG